VGQTLKRLGEISIDKRLLLPKVKRPLVKRLITRRLELELKLERDTYAPVEPHGLAWLSNKIRGY